MKLVIISHTEHYYTADGLLVGHGSTVTEINHLLTVFDEIWHVAMLHDKPAPPSALPYTSDKIHFVPIPAVGGKSFVSKTAILWSAPKILATIGKTLKKVDYFQFRAPTGIGVFVIPYLVAFTHKKGWFKYAGNWQQQQAPLAYGFQRWLLINQKRKVTINGVWENQPKHCLSFENPCLSEVEVLKGKEALDSKVFDSRALEFCFVGRLEDAKGIGLLIEAFSELSLENKKRIKTIHIVGDGSMAQPYKDFAEETGLPFVFYGFLPRDEVHTIYQIAHALLLPSVSEGFPKVISEAMNYGCIPIVSNVSSISHYIKNEVNGLLMNVLTKEELLDKLEGFFNISEERFFSMAKLGRSDVGKFTYAFYCNRIKNKLI